MSRLSEVVLAYRVDSATLAKAEATVERFTANIRAIGGEAARSADLLSLLTGASAELGRQKAISEITEQISQMGSLLGVATDKAQLLRDTLAQVGATQDEIAGAVAQLEQLGAAQQASAGGSAKGSLSRSIFAKAQQAAGSVGLGGLSNIANIADDLTDLGAALGEAGISAGALTAGLLVAAPAALALALAVNELAKRSADGKRAADSAVAANKTYFDSLALTSEEITRLLGEQRAKQQRDQAELAKLQTALEGTFAAQTQAYGQFLGGLGDGAARLQTFTDQVAQSTGGLLGESQLAGVRSRIAELQKALGETAGSIGGLETALKTGEVATNDAVAAEQRLAAERQKAVDAQVGEIQRRAEVDAKLADLARTGTREQLDSALAANQRQREIIQQQLSALDQIKDPSQAVAGRVDDLRRELRSLDYELLGLLDRVSPSVIEFDKLSKGAASLTDAFKGASVGAVKLGSGLLDAIQDAGEKRASLEGKFQNEVAKIASDGLERRAQIEGKYADTLVAIAEDAADHAAKALTKLQQQQADLRRDLGRDLSATERKRADDELSARIDAARADEAAFRAHLAKLQQIRAAAQDKEFEQSLNRDFAGLFLTRRDTARQLAQANGDFSAERQQRQADTQAKIDDLQRQAAIEKRERQIAFDNRLQDARIAYQRERAEQDAQRLDAVARAKIAHDKEVAALEQGLRAQMAARRTALNQELALVNQGVAQRVKTELQAQTALVQGAQRAAGIISALLGAIKAPVHRAGGGSLAAGVLAAVNEPGISSGHESFVTGGRTFAFPSPGLFIPTQTGYVDAGRGVKQQPVTITNNFSISGAGNPQATADLVQRQVVRALEHIFK